MNVTRMAWRNVWRNPRRSGVTILAMAFALWVMVLYSGLIEGYLQGMQADVLDLEVGELQIHAANYRDDPSLYNRMDDSALLLEALDSRGYRAAARLTGGGLAASGESSAGVRISGLDPVRDATVSELHGRVVEGEWLDARAPDGVVLGRRVAKSLGVSLGGEVLLLSQGADGSVANALYEVRGILGIVSDGIDRSTVLMTEGAFRELMVVEQGAHQIVVRLPEGRSLADAQAEISSMAPTHAVETWRQILPMIATMLDSTRGLLMVVFFIVYIAIAILVLNAMLMAVFERIREFGVMKAIGVGPGAVLAMIALETLLQTGAAMALGLLLSLPFMAYLSQAGIDVGILGGTSMLGMTMRQRWHGIFGIATVAGPVLALAIMVTVAALYPALKAAWIRPLDAMRFR